MDLLLSSPVPIIVFLFLLVAIVAVFIFELKSARKEEKPAAAPPLPPTSIPLPKKQVKKTNRVKKPVIIASTILLLILLISVPIGVFLIQQRQQIQEEAARPEPTIGAPGITTPPSLPSPTPTTATAPLPSPTQTAKPPACLSLTATPLSGTAPLSVIFEAQAKDEDGFITSFLFDYGDDTTQRIDKTFPAGQTASQTTEHVYTQAGDYQATVTILDNDVLFSAATTDCTVNISVKSSSEEEADQEGSGESVSLGTGGSEFVLPTATPTATDQVETLGIGGPAASPTATLTITPTSSQTASPSAEEPVSPEIPEAGYGLPTLIATIGGALLLLVAAAMAF